MPKRKRAAAAPRRFLACPYGEKDEAKALGAKWDQAERQWYIPDGLEPASFARWNPTVSLSAASSAAESKMNGEPKRQRHEAPDE